jgi:hypothetical protein
MYIYVYTHIIMDVLYLHKMILTVPPSGYGWWILWVLPT